jgi:N-alpha-acetyltransferase 50
MLDHVFNICEREGNIDSIYLYVRIEWFSMYMNGPLFLFFRRHVQVNNETALSFYKKFGFEIISTANEYYRRLEPCDAYLLERSLKKTSSNESTTASSSVQQNSKKMPTVPLSTMSDLD